VADSDHLVYSRGVLSVAQIQGEIARFWRDLGSSSELGAELGSAGFDTDTLVGIRPEDSISVRADSSGADPASVLLIITFAPTANRVLKDLWAKILLPRIQRRWGDDAIGDRKNGRE
jgi:hypothetical protein